MRQSRLDKQVERSLVALMEAEEAEKVLSEQVDTWSEIRDDLRTRALVSETPLAQAEAQDAARHARAQEAQRDDLVRSIRQLETEQDALLDQMAAEMSGS